jgi:ubiquinone/menaquinone biosynthesis C-methylase UbiE
MSSQPLPDASVSFDQSAESYAATMARSLRPVAADVVRRAALGPGERVLDIGSGTGIAAAAAVGEGRTVMGVDGAPGMLDIARRDVPGATFAVMDFTDLRFDDGSWDVTISSHALLFAEDRVAALAEWRRVVRDGGRLSLSVPGPGERTPITIYGKMYERYRIDTDPARYPTEAQLAEWAVAAGWSDIHTAADPEMAIRLSDDAAFRAWRSIGSRAVSSAHLSESEHEELTSEMLAVTPREPDGTLRIPFGALYLTARNGPAR